MSAQDLIEFPQIWQCLGGIQSLCQGSNSENLPANVEHWLNDIYEDEIWWWSPKKNLKLMPNARSILKKKIFEIDLWKSETHQKCHSSTRVGENQMNLAHYFCLILRTIKAGLKLLSHSNQREAVDKEQKAHNWICTRWWFAFATWWWCLLTDERMTEKKNWIKSYWST